MSSPPLYSSAHPAVSFGSLAVRDGHFIGGAFVASLSQATFDVVNPSTGQVLASAAAGEAADIDAAVQAAHACWRERSWAGRTGAERSEVLLKMASLITEHKAALARLESMQQGKCLAEAEGDMDDTAACFTYYAGLAANLDRDGDTEVRTPDDRMKARVLREPRGVCAAIVPWNYPTLMAAWKVAPALAAGCCLVLKPSEYTPLTALALALIGSEAGLPAGALNVVTGTGPGAGAPLAARADIAKLAFTGSVPTGTAIMSAAAKNLTPITLELGGKSAMIVFEDVDIEATLEWILMGIFFNQGQVCSATSRLLVHESIAPALIERLVEEANRLVVGDPLAVAEAKLGPLVSKPQFERVRAYIKSGLEQGATLLCGGLTPPAGTHPGGFFVAPTIFKDVTDDMKIWKEEIFGPVLCVRTFKTEAEAISTANNSPYGLAAAVMSKDLERCERVVRALEVGICWVNCSQPTYVELPWGGVKKSGIGRELGPWGLDNYLNIKQVTRYAADTPFGWYDTRKA